MKKHDYKNYSTTSRNLNIRRLMQKGRIVQSNPSFNQSIEDAAELVVENGKAHLKIGRGDEGCFKRPRIYNVHKTNGKSILWITWVGANVFLRLHFLQLSIYINLSKVFAYSFVVRAGNNRTETTQLTSNSIKQTHRQITIKCNFLFF